jgi:hypothetical protein
MFSNVPPTGNGHNVLLAIQFVSHDVGWLGAGNLENTNIYKTTNGGADWAFQDNPVSQMGWNQINDVMFISPDTGWAAHGTPGTGAIMFTSNGGAEWLMDNTEYSWYDCLSHDGVLTAWSGGSEGGVWYRADSAVTHVSQLEPQPEEFSLLQNYPNPFNPSTIISFELASKSTVSLRVFDVLGREVMTLVSGELPAGTFERQWEPDGLASGVYIYQLRAGDYVETRKLMLMR